MLKAKAKNALNPYRCKYNPVAMSCHYFYKHCPLSINYADPFIKDEEEWLINSAMGGLIWAENHTVLRYGYEYDINSMYPYLMTKCAYITRRPHF